MNEENTVPNLSDYFSEGEINDVVLGLSQNLARTRHEDFDEVVDSHEFTDTQSEDILSGKVDPAEKMYEIAKAANFVPAEELYDGDGGDVGPELDPDSAEALYSLYGGK